MQLDFLPFIRHRFSGSGDKSGQQHYYVVQRTMTQIH
jgi:hypothetical protein